MKRILVTTDLSVESTAAFPVAVRLAGALGAEILLLAVLEDPAQAAMMPTMDVPLLPAIDLEPQLRERAEADLKELSAKHFGGLSCSYVLRESSGPVAAEIVDFAGEHAVDLIVMTTHGRRGLAHMLIGSVTEQVMQQSSVPVVAVPIGGKRRAEAGR